MEFDHYDLFNAPQYIDFNEFVKNDGFGDDGADQYFETHKEEDDFLLPIDSVSPPLNSSNNNGKDKIAQNNNSPEEPMKSVLKDDNSIKVTPSGPKRKENPSYAELNQIDENKNPTQVSLSKNSPKVQLVEPLYKQTVKISLSPKIEQQPNLNECHTKEEKAVKIEQQEVVPLPIKEVTPYSTNIKAINDVKNESTSTMPQAHPTPLLNDPKSVGDSISVSAQYETKSDEKEEDVNSVRGTTQVVVHHVKEYAIEEKGKEDKLEHEMKDVEQLATTISNHEMKTDSKVEIKQNDEIEVHEKKGNTTTTAIASSSASIGPDIKHQFHTETKPKIGPRSSIPSLNHKLLKGAAVTIPKKITLSSKVTVPQPFHFSTTRVRKIPEPEKDTFSGFKAKPAPMKILKGDVLKMEKHVVKTTHPQTIHFASDDRIRERNLKKLHSAQTELKEEQPSRCRSRSVGRLMMRTRTPSKERIPTSSTQSLIPVGTSARKTEPKSRERSRSNSRDRSKPIHVQPFSFEERDKEMLRKKEEKILKALKEEQKIKPFHAQPLPDYQKAMKKFPKKHSIPSTNPEPFKLKCDERGMNYHEELKRQLEEESRRLRQEAEFTAKVLPISHVKPFQPEKSTAPLAEPLEIHLNTDRRAQDREKFQQSIKEKEAELEVLRHREKVVREEQEKKMTHVLRQLLVHKAKPVPHYRVFEVRSSETPLTNPKSPAFELLPSQRHPRHSEPN